MCFSPDLLVQLHVSSYAKNVLHKYALKCFVRIEHAILAGSPVSRCAYDTVH